MRRAIGQGVAFCLTLIAAATAAAQPSVIATNPQGSAQFSTGAAVAKLMSEKLGLATVVQPRGGSTTFIPMLNRGELEFSFANALEASLAHSGTGSFNAQPNPDIRLMGMIYPLYLGLIVAKDSPIQRVPEAKGLRVATEFVSQNIMVYVVGAMLANGGLGYADMQGVPVTNANQGQTALADGRLDITSSPPGSGISLETHAKLARRGGIRFLPLDPSPEALARMRSVIPSAWVATLEPANNRPGILEPTPIMAYPMFMITHKGTADAMVYKIVEGLSRNKDALVASFGGFQPFDPKLMAPKDTTPYHPGAIQYYREHGLAP